MHTAQSECLLELPAGEAWDLLTDPRHVRSWFADCGPLSEGQPFRFDFGDGDYFEGAWDRADAPRELVWRWRFWGIGPEFVITWLLHPHGPRTLVAVHDRGAPRAQEAEELSEGWADFLGRLAAYSSHGGSTRYDWSRAIGASALLPADPRKAFDRLIDRESWGEAFPDARLEVALEGNNNGETVAKLVITEPAWESVPTRATVSAYQGDDGVSLVKVLHRDWESIPGDPRAERVRYAGLWRDYLARIESGG